MHARRLASALSGIALAGVLAAAFAACAGQGENERCDLERAGNDDCNAGLICIHVSGVGTSICCNPDPTQRAPGTLCAGGGATTTPTTDGATSDTSTPTDTGVVDTGAADSADATDAEDATDASDAADAADAAETSDASTAG